MTLLDRARHVTPQPWHAGLQHARYATDETYQRAAAWLQDCATVADWGGGTGYLARFLAPSVQYRVVDGTWQCPAQVLADLEAYHEPSEGIVLRHVLDMTQAWRRILQNALDACTQRLCVITFTPPAPETTLARMKSGWPVMHFNADDLRVALGAAYRRDEPVRSTHPERVYYAETR